MNVKNIWVMIITLMAGIGLGVAASTPAWPTIFAGLVVLVIIVGVVCAVYTIIVERQNKRHDRWANGVPIRHVDEWREYDWGMVDPNWEIRQWELDNRPDDDRDYPF